MLHLIYGSAGTGKTTYITEKIKNNPNITVIEEEVDHILKVVPEVVQHLRNMSPVWRDLQTGKREYIL